MTEHPGPHCRTEPDGIVHHGWDCDESDPLADVLSALVGWPATGNPILDESRQRLVDRWTPDEETDPVRNEDLCPMSDLPPGQCALPCHLGVALPAGADPDVTRGVEPSGVRVWPPAGRVHETRDTRARPRRPKPQSTCRWNPDVDGWVTPEHVRACVSNSCRGCKPCSKTHCAMRGSCPNHVNDKVGERTCPGCIGGCRGTITEVETLSALVGDELAHVVTVEHAVTGPLAPIWTHTDVVDIVNLAGPAADQEHLDTRRTVTRQTDDTRGWCQWPQADVYAPADDEHPAAVLARWEYLFRAHYGHPQRAQETALWPRPHTTSGTSVSQSADYLRGLLAGSMPHDDVFERFDSDMTRLRTHLEDTLSDSRKPETGAPCPSCAVQLELDHAAGGERRRPPRLEKHYGHWCDDPTCEREHDNTGANDRWVCTAGHVFTEAEYRLRIGTAYLANADQLSSSQIQQQYDVPAGTLSRWANGWNDSRGNEIPACVRKRGRDGQGRLLYEVKDVKAAIARFRSVGAPVEDEAREA